MLVKTGGLRLVRSFVKDIFPEDEIQLDRWKRECGFIADGMLRSQALLSITNKKFHVQGGSIYSLYPGTASGNMAGFIAAFQTISDYLDNLCDRAKVYDPAAFRKLHTSMIDAITPYTYADESGDYYSLYPYKNDNGYLCKLVAECRNHISVMPAFDIVGEALKKYTGLYSELQANKHLIPSQREDTVVEWAQKHLNDHPGISCWEFSAAAGSTLGIFVLAAAAFDPRLTRQEAEALEKAYFPWVCGLHILLDYLIDYYEDIEEKDLNFVYYYSSFEQCANRLAFFLEKSVSACRQLRYPDFHLTVIRGLLAMYLSDPKGDTKGVSEVKKSLLKNGGADAKLYYWLCRLLRSKGKL